MQNRIDLELTEETRDQVLDLLKQIQTLLPFLVDLTPDERMSLTKMGNSGKPFVDESLNLVEQDDSFMPRSLDRQEMRKDKDFYEKIYPVRTLMMQIFDGVDDTVMLTGSDLIIAGLSIYENAKANGKGENLDNLVPLLGRRFKQKTKKDTGDQPS